VQLARGLAGLADRTGRRIRVALEPEPGCVLEDSAGVVEFFEGPLARAGDRSDRGAVADHLGVCLDACHLAVVFEPPEQAVETLVEAGIAVAKVQLSSALEVPAPADPRQRQALGRFHERRYLHQVRVAGHPAEGADDLGVALARLRTDAAWRVHFHVPIDRAQLTLDSEGDPVTLGTTQADLETALAAVLTAGACTTFEVETYTFPALPGLPPGPLAEGISREVAWARAKLI
jgi:hypothetical protein